MHICTYTYVCFKWTYCSFLSFNQHWVPTGNLLSRPGCTVGPGKCGLCKVCFFFQCKLISVLNHSSLLWCSLCYQPLWYRYISPRLNSRLQRSNDGKETESQFNSDLLYDYLVFSPTCDSFWNSRRNNHFFQADFIDGKCCRMKNAERAFPDKTAAPHEAVHALETTLEKLTLRNCVIKRGISSDSALSRMWLFFLELSFIRSEVLGEVDQTQKYWNHP